MTRLAIILAVAATPAAAQTDLTRQARWSAGTTETVKGISRTTALDFRRTGPEAWAVEVRCERMDLKTKKWTAKVVKGTAVRREGVILGDAGALGKWIIGPRQDIAFPDNGLCASGKADLGTGD